MENRNLGLERKEAELKKYEKEIIRNFRSIMKDWRTNKQIEEAHGSLDDFLNKDLPRIRKLKRERSPLYILDYLDCISYYIAIVESLGGNIDI